MVEYGLVNPTGGFTYRRQPVVRLRNEIQYKLERREPRKGPSQGGLYLDNILQ